MSMLYHVFEEPEGSFMFEIRFSTPSFKEAWLFQQTEKPVHAGGSLVIMKVVAGVLSEGVA